jgi:hypothetical protein
MIPALIERIGGADRLAAVKRSVAPEYLEVDIAMWIKDSEEQEGGFIDTAAIAMLAKIGAREGLNNSPSSTSPCRR